MEEIEPSVSRVSCPADTECAESLLGSRTVKVTDFSKAAMGKIVFKQTVQDIFQVLPNQFRQMAA